MTVTVTVTTAQETPTVDAGDSSERQAPAANELSASRTVLLEAVVGSTAYGLARDGSDIDSLGVYVAATEQVLALSGRSVVDSSVIRSNPDRTLHELGKYLRLAFKGNPTVLELLFASSYTVHTDAGQQLLDIRTALLGADGIRTSYGGYARQQAQRLARRHEAGLEGFSSDVISRTAKHARHCLRLLYMGEQLLTTGTLTLDISHRRTELFTAGQLAVSDPHEFKRLFEVHDARLQSVVSVLPDRPNLAVVNDTLVRIRLAQLAGD